MVRTILSILDLVFSQKNINIPIQDFINMNILSYDEFIEEQNYETIDELLQTIYTDEMLLEMANISQNTTGLDVIIWLQTNNTQSTGKIICHE